MSTTLTLPDDLAETYAEIARRDGRPLTDVVLTALEIYADRAAESQVRRSEETTPSSRIGMARESNGEHADAPHGRARHFESLGVGESTLDDGYDSTNIKDWIRKTWRPDVDGSTG